MRSLILHVSALNDDEYTLFTSSFADLVASDQPLHTDDDFEKLTVPNREARAWLRGRYSDLPVSDLDQVRISLYSLPVSPSQLRAKILRLFSTSSGQDATLSKGQFFAVLRLVLHVRGGAELDRNLVFKQGSSPFVLSASLLVCVAFRATPATASISLLTITPQSI
jgi:hypothetical protein